MALKRLSRRTPWVKGSDINTGGGRPSVLSVVSEFVVLIQRVFEEQK